MKKVSWLLSVSFLVLLCLNTSVFAQGNDGAYIYRLYNKATTEHLYSNNRTEANSLVRSGGWEDEGIGWTAPSSGEAVMRIYNPRTNDHLYTSDQNEIRVLFTTQGWVPDFEGQPMFYSGGSIPIYRLYNPATGRHHLTTDWNEWNILPSRGWQGEGIVMYCQAEADPYLSPKAVQDRILSLKAQYLEDMPWTNANSYYSEALREKGYGCHAFALICSDAAFGNLPGRRHNDLSNIKIGDILRVDSSGKKDNHTIVVTDIQGDVLTLAEGNWQKDIHWGRKAKISDFQVEYVLTRYPY